MLRLTWYIYIVIRFLWNILCSLNDVIRTPAIMIRVKKVIH